MQPNHPFYQGCQKKKKVAVISLIAQTIRPRKKVLRGLSVIFQILHFFHFFHFVNLPHVTGSESPRGQNHGRSPSMKFGNA
ncbi:hypothetical protein BDV28DRAFT_142044 [Aspergillus coremiiformis]|uniref:Uncharacterized protein n=1 Tax=Aspergillus coremiiformis TaxID=138285 RepID=A0A5N6YU83_9EURO|nr:hypothetical protein BDV28DRAFT_142044 [Aspergillus coremiiformis]